MLACSAICMNAASPTVDLQMEKATDNLKVTTIKNSTSKNVTRIAKGVTLSTANGIKKLNTINSLNKKAQGKRLVGGQKLLLQKDTCCLKVLKTGMAPTTTGRPTDGQST